MIVDVTEPSTMSSSTPVTVTVCAVSQFAAVNVSELVTVASPVSPDEIGERRRWLVVRLIQR